MDFCTGVCNEATPSIDSNRNNNTEEWSTAEVSIRMIPICWRLSLCRCSGARGLLTAAVLLLSLTHTQQHVDGMAATQEERRAEILVRNMLKYCDRTNQLRIYIKKPAVIRYLSYEQGRETDAESSSVQLSIPYILMCTKLSLSSSSNNSKQAAISKDPSHQSRTIIAADACIRKAVPVVDACVCVC